MGFSIEGKIAVVTGGGRDIGRACCLELAANGADVVVNYHSSAESAARTVDEIEAQGRRAIAVGADVTKPDDINALRDAALEFGEGRVDILVNNAGGIIRRALLGDLDPELIEETLRLNFTSVVLLCQAIVPIMAEQGGGKVINISSVAGHNGGAPTTPHYGPAKAAVSNFSRTLTKEFGSSNIQVNSVAPGIIDNRFHQDHTPPDMFEKLVAGVPLARAGTNEDVAGAVAFLASPNADYISGDVIHVNGGLYFGQ